MKRIIKTFALLAFSWLIFGCEEDNIIFDGPYHVRFTDSTATFKESHPEIIEIGVHLVGPQIDDDLDITYVVGGTAREGKDYEFITEKGRVSIDDGDSFGTIRIRLLNNANNILDEQTLELTLITVNNRNVAVGQGKIGRKYVLTIEDDCILGGVYTAQYTNDTRVPPIDDITISSNDCIEYTVSNWDINLLFTDYFQYGFFLPLERDLVFVDNLDNTITIPQQTEQTIEENNMISGSGAYNPVNGVITLNISLEEIPEAPVIQISFTPKRSE